MLFNILKRFGLDIPAKIEAVKASFELRVEQATDHVKQVAREAAIIGTLSALAAMTAAMAAGVGLIALYRWTTDAYGPYAGLGVVGVILVAATVTLATAATIKARSLAPNGIKVGRYAAGTGSITDPDVITSASVADAAAAEPYSDRYSRTSFTAATPAAPTSSASDLVKPLAFVLSKFVKYPNIGNPVVDELIGNLRATAHGTADEAIDRAADVIRHGDRTNLIVVLTGAAFIGWLLSHHSQH
jgi:hypothetical protein